MKTIIEPFKVKMVEPIRFSSPAERQRWAEEASWNLFKLGSDQVMIDLLTDSGTSAMSAEQWAGIMRGDEAYAGAKSWFRFLAAVQDIFGFGHVVPTHQGRAAERILFQVMVSDGDYIPNNTHFDTTRANIEQAGGNAIDLPCAVSADLHAYHPFKGDMDVEALDKLIEQVGPQRVPLVMLTLTNNSGGGQPVSLANVRAVSEVAHRYGIPLYIDACRFAENAWFIKEREEGQAHRSVRDIVRDVFACSDGCTMSAKKDGLTNIGGFLCTRDPNVAAQEKAILILTEGFPTYGGMAGRDLEAIAIGLEEVLHHDYLHYRTRSTAYLADGLDAAGVPVVLPAGGHAVYLDARRFLPHIPPLHYPGQSLAVELYLEAGIRSCEIGTVMFGRTAAGETEQPGRNDLVRLAIPRRVYTQSHIDYVLEAVIDVHARRESIRGMKIVEEPAVLRHFTAEFAWR